MALGDFVLGKGAQHDSPLENGQSNTRNSRQRAAELARVNVPRTKLNGFTAPAGGPFQRANETHGYNNQNARVGAGDMFDTDVEAIDDSTTVTSLGFEKSDAGQAFTGNAPSPREDARAYARVDQSLNVAAGRREVQDTYRPVAERMRELDSDPADHDGTGMRFQEAQHEQENVDAARGEIDGEDMQSLGWNGNHASDGGPLSWQRIEEVLHENHNRRDNSVTAEVAPIPSPVYREQGFAEEQPQAFGIEETDDDGRYRSTPQTPQPPQKTPTKGRVSVRSRFMTPNFQNDRRNSHFGANPGDSQSFIPRPSSAPGVPPSPRSSRRQTITKRTAATASHSPLPQEARNNYQPYAHGGGGGVFDTTDLSALDSLDSPSHQDTFASPHLSSLSTASPSSSSKRPLSETKTSETPFTSDYPPNILRTKAYSDLQAESFDYNPAPPQPIFPPQEPALPLEERLSRIKTLTDDQRRALLSGLTLAEWEESGDWLIDQFSIILQKTKAARQERRKIAAVFEAEIKRRYELAENEGKDVRNRLDDMRSGGMGVLKKTEYTTR